MSVIRTRLLKTIAISKRLLWAFTILILSQGSTVAQTLNPSTDPSNTSTVNTDTSNAQEKKTVQNKKTYREDLLSHPNFGAAYRNSGATFFIEVDDAPMPINTTTNPVLPYSRWNPPKRLVMQHFNPQDTAWIEKNHFMQRVWEAEGGSRDFPIAFLSVGGGMLKLEDNKFAVLYGSGGSSGFFRRDPTFPGGALPDWTAQEGETFVDFEDKQVLFYAVEYQLTSKKKYSCEKKSGKGCVLYKAKMRLSVIARPKNYDDFWGKGPKVYYETNKPIGNTPRLYTPYATYPVIDVFIEDKNAGGNAFNTLFYTRSKASGFLYWLAH